jgi:hypothetical protein
MVARRLLLLACGLLSASGGKTLPAFYTKTDAFPAALKEATADCGAAASFHHEGGVPFIELRTGDAAAHAVEKDHPQAPVRIMLVFGEHARELVSPELSLRLARDICASVKSGANIARFMQTDLRDGSSSGAAAGVGSDSAAYASALQYLATQVFSIRIVPLANAAGRRTVEQGQFCKRTNGADVDLNRNWDAHWQAADGTTAADSMPGSGPFSEAETQALRAVMLEFRPHMFLSVHSGTLGMYSPPAFAPDAEAGLGDDPARAAQVARLRKMLATVAGETPSVGGQTVVVSASKAADPARFMQQGLRSYATRERAAAVAGAAAQISGAGADTGRGSSGKGAGRRNRKLSHASSAAISSTARSAAGAGTVPFGGAAETVGYRCPGTCLDFAAENGGVGYSFAFEIWGTPTVSMSQQQQHRRRRRARKQRAAAAAAGRAVTGHAQRFRQMDGAMLDAAPAASGGAASAAALVMEDLGALQPLIDELGSAGTSGSSSAAAAAGMAGASGRGAAELGLLELESGSAAAAEEGADAFAGEGNLAAAEADAGVDADVDAAAAAAAGVDASIGVAGGVQLHEVTVGSCFIERSAALSGDATAALAVSEASVDAAAAAGSRVDAEAEHEHSHEHEHGAASSAAAFLTAEECLGFFNPVTEADFQATMAAWSARTARLMQLVHAQVLQDRGVKPAQ